MSTRRTVAVAGMAALTMLAAAAPAVADPGHGGATQDGGSSSATAIRVLLLTATAVVAGLGLFAPVSGPAGTARRVLAWSAAGLVLVVAVPAINQVDIELPILVAHLALVLAVPALLARPPAMALGATALTVLLCVEATFVHSGAARWLGVAHVAFAVVWLGTVAAVATATASTDLGRRLAPLAVGSGVVVAGTGILQANLVGVGLDVRLVDTAFGLVLLAKTVLLLVVGTIGVLAVRRRAPRGAFRFATAGLAGALAAGAALAAVPLPDPLPTTGVPLLRDVALGDSAVPVFVSPHRPGRNLVQVGATENLEVGTDPARLTPVEPVAGASGGWATVDLPPGPGTLFVRRGGETAEIRLDTGTSPAPAAATGTDGPECASFALGAILAERAAPVTSCPAEALDPRDEESLRGLLGFLTGRGLGSVALLSDGSPRAKAAEELVAATGVPVVGVDTGGADALIVVSGWAPATTELTKIGERQRTEAIFGHGVYLAPWLLNTPVLRSVSSVILPLRFNPHEQLPATYAGAVGARFPGESPSAAGYRGWLSAQPDGAARLGDTKPLLYTASLVGFLPREYQHHQPEVGWLPNGTVVPVSGPLS